jgi:hypothetical protein
VDRPLTEDAIRRLERRWEGRFPGLDGEWTHWWIEADGAFLAVVSGHELSTAVRVVRDNWERFASIFVHRARVDAVGTPRREAARVEVANRLYNSRWAR